ncbi:MAG TPA: DUF2017 family protein [Actinomycetota bacterium]|nr:DUF2017 family protein [Actinomycetota bacterium]
MPRFSRSPGGVRVELDEDEAGLLRRLVEEMVSLLEANAGPADPVVDRLFPAAYGGAEPEAEQDFRRYAGSELERLKLEGARRTASDLGETGPASLTLDEDAASGWLALLTDLRLAIGTRLGVDEEKMARDLDPRDPEAPALGVLHWLGWVQEEILHHLA